MSITLYIEWEDGSSKQRPCFDLADALQALATYNKLAGLKMEYVTIQDGTVTILVFSETGFKYWEIEMRDGERRVEMNA